VPTQCLSTSELSGEEHTYYYDDVGLSPLGEPGVVVAECSFKFILQFVYYL
jgi:hypothetical protein